MISIVSVIGAASDSVLMASSLGINPVSGGMPPIDSSSKAKGMIIVVYDIMGVVNMLVWYRSTETRRVKTGIMIAEYTVKYNMVRYIL